MTCQWTLTYKQMECAQIEITGGGNTQPATVSFPGAYSGTCHRVARGQCSVTKAPLQAPIQESSSISTSV